MTYETLLKRLTDLNKEQLDKDVTVLIDEKEYHPIQRLILTDRSCDILDEGHPVLVI